MIKDSGNRITYGSGMNRDIDDGKPRYDLMDVPMLTKWAKHMAEGAKKYGDNNWKKANSKEEMQRFKASAFRHFIQWFNGEDDESHDAAVFFNISAANYVESKLDETG